MSATSTLPPHITSKLNQTLAQWRAWQCDPQLRAAPRAIRLLGAGRSNYSILVATAQSAVATTPGHAKSAGHFVVRIDGVTPAQHGISRQAEWRVLQTAAAKQLAPMPRYYNPELGALVCDYLPSDDAREERVEDVADLLRKIHALPPRHLRLDLRARITQYEQQLAQYDSVSGSDLLQYKARVHQCTQQLVTDREDSVLCHNDLLRANRIFSAGKLRAIDWEYCAMASRWYELAVVVHGDEWSLAQTDRLLSAYLGRKPKARETTLLATYGCVYRYLELLWYCVRNNRGLTAEQRATKLAALDSLLAKRA